MNNLAYELQTLINQGSKKYPMPYKEGNSIRMGKVVIRAKKNSYLLFDCEHNEQICVTNSKYGALAAAKKYLAGEKLTTVLILDRKYQKHLNDTAFYKHTMRSANNSRKQIVETRLDLSEAQKNSAVFDLETIIFN